MTAQGTPREIVTAGPGAEAQELRRAYLGLLKLAVCDLLAPSTTSVEGLPHGQLVARELSGEERALRAQGRDWPLHGLSMSGLARLDDLQRCVESIVADGVEGDLIEAGCWRGGASILMRATLDSLGAGDRTVWVADSFQGFRPADPEFGREPSAEYPGTLEPYLAVFDFLAAPLEEVKASFVRFGCERGTRFLPGFFEDTLPAIADRRWSLVRLDADTYDATLLALRSLYPGLAIGGYLLVDDYDALDECRAAVDRFRSEHGIEEPLERVDWTGVRWRRKSAAATQPPRATDRPAPPRPRAAASPRKPLQVPSARERSLGAEVADLRARVAELQSALAQAERLRRELTGSASWRLTRPLRELGRYIRARQR